MRKRLLNCRKFRLQNKFKNMNKIILYAILLIIIASSCSRFSSLSSVTTIAPAEAFVLGKGKHGSYNAEIKNIGKVDVEITQSNEEGVKTSLGILKVGDTKKCPVNKNTSVSFKNSSNSQEATIKIYAQGDTSLSMGYEKNN